jgi:hypothetical protein
MTFTAPANTTRTTANTQAAILFDSNMLYVAFASECQPADKVDHDGVSLFLDTTHAGDGTEMVRITVNSDGSAECTWIRSATPAERREDGLPDFAHPVSTIPDIQIPGLVSHVTGGTHEGKGMWEAVVGVPMRALPMPLRTSPAAGARWKVNLLRTVTVGQHKEQLQANLSPVYVGAQELAPYRMADLTLVQ